MIRVVKKILGVAKAKNSALSDESRIVAALIYMCGEHTLRGNIFQLCTVMETTKSQCVLVNGLKFVRHGRGYYSSRVDKAIKEMQVARFVWWNKEQNELRIDRSKPVHDSFVCEVRLLPRFDVYRTSIKNAANFIGFVLGSP